MLTSSVTADSVRSIDYNYTDVVPAQVNAADNASAFDDSYDVIASSCTDESNGCHVTSGSSPIKGVVSIVLSLLIAGIIIGNALVIISIAIFEKMRTLSNGLIASLASADLLVAVAVLPISLQYEMTGQWTLGSHICDLWITSDVFCCTASILNIVVIAVDRYWLITRNVRYTHSTVLPRRTVCALLTVVAWIVSALIASSPLLGWRTGNEHDDPTSCLISQDYGYTIFSTFGAFWFPLSIILVVYARIFWFARSRVMRLEQTAGKARTTYDDGRSCAIGTTYTTEPTTVMPAAISCRRKSSRTFRSVDSNSPSESTAAAVAATDQQVPAESQSYSTSPPLPFTLTSDHPAETVRSPLSAQIVETNNAANRMRKTRLRRMRRSARTLGLIIGGFVICWLPFFVVATVAPFCSWCTVPPTINSVVLWLGYSNSLFNPAIYAIWDQSFRRSFKRILTCQIR